MTITPYKRQANAVILQAVRDYRDALVELKTGIYRFLKRLPDDRHRLLLEQRFLCGKTWEEITDELDVSERQFYYLRQQAFAEAERQNNFKALPKQCLLP